MPTKELFIPTQELATPSGESPALAEISQAVRREGLWIGRLNNEQVVDSVAKTLLGFNYQVRERNDELLETTDVTDYELAQRLHASLLGNSAEYTAINMIANHFRPGDFMPKHTDLSYDLGIDDKDPFETTMTFLYVAAGSKEFLIYPFGEEAGPMAITQEPGMLIAFPMFDVYDKDRKLVQRGLPHEVPTQNADCYTLTWEVCPTIDNERYQSQAS